LKILLLNWQDPANPRAGGAEIHLHEVFRRLQARGHQVTWLVSGWKGAPPEDRLDGMRILRAASRYTFGPAAPLFFRRKLAPETWDVVVEALNKVPLYSPAWAATPFVLLVHHLFGTTAFQEAPLPLAALTWLQERPLNRIYGATPVQAISHSTADDLVRRGLIPERIDVIHPGVNLDFFHPPSSPTRLATPTFLYLGRLQRYKRVDLILEAFAVVRARWKQARLLIAGRGGHEAELRRHASDLGLGSAVEFTGFVTEEVKRELFRSAWANVLVSPNEGWGITNLEAAACGTATIASDSPGLRESVVHGRTGLLVPHGNVAALASAMGSFAAEPQRMEELGRGAREFARVFTWERTATLTERHLAASIHSRPRAEG
jgi:glycosyltransferase involved in cell wall biosynthesis